MSIPKIIHFCWLSENRMPPLVKRCMATWKEVLPGYEIIWWNPARFHLDSTPWTREAFASRKYAFASDYIRCHALYHHGGIYLDTDVEVLSTFDPLLHHPYMLGKENPALIEAAAMGAEPGSTLFGKMLGYYEGKHFIKPDGSFDTTPMPVIMEKIVRENFRVREISSPDDAVFSDDTLSILPDDFFSPKSCADGKIRTTENTVCIHHYNQSWQSPVRKYGRKLILGIGGEKLKDSIRHILARHLS